MKLFNKAISIILLISFIFSSASLNVCASEADDLAELENMEEAVSGNELGFGNSISGNAYEVCIDETEEYIYEEITAEEFAIGALSKGGTIIDSVTMYTDSEQYNHDYDVELVRAWENLEAVLDVSDWSFPLSDLSAIWDVLNMNPQVFYVNHFGYTYNSSSGEITKLYFYYDDTEDEIRKQILQLNSAIDKINENINTSGMTEVEIALAFHDYFASHIEYDYDNYLQGTLPSTSYNIYGAVVEGMAVCQGYAEAMLYFLKQKNIVSGIASSDTANHAWNVMEQDGKWYHIDVTWDDPVRDVPGRVLHNYFMLSTEELLEADDNRADFITKTAYSNPFIPTPGTDYKDKFWKKSNTAFYFYNDYIYGLVSSESNSNKYQINKYHYMSNTSEVLLEGTATWKVPGTNSYYIGNYGKIMGIGSNLYYSTPTEILNYNLETGESGQVYQYEGDEGCIYAFGWKRGKIVYIISDNPNNIYGKDIHNLDLNTEEEGDTKIKLEITGQPKDVTAKTGEKVSFHVSAEGTGLSYAWQYSRDGGKSWADIKVSNYPSASSADFEMTVKAQDGYRYRCVVTDAGGNSATSSAATLTVSASGVKITGQPSDVTAKTGEKVSFHVSAGGTGLSYAWQYSRDGGKSWADIKVSNYPSASSADFEMTVKAQDGYRYRCVVTDAGGNSATSSAATLTVSASGVKITGQPSDVTAKTGEKVSFHVSAGGTGLSYAWQYSRDGGKSWADIKVSNYPSASSADFEMTVKAQDGYRYRCVVTDAGGNSATSSAATLTVSASGVKITGQPSDVTAKTGEKIMFHVSAEGTGLSYAWQYSRDGGKSWADIKVSNYPSAHSADFEMTVKAQDGYRYRCVVTDAGGNSATSSAATLTVSTSGVKITGQPSDVTAKTGEKIMFHVSAEGTGLSYAWQYSRDGGKSWADIKVSNYPSAHSADFEMTVKAQDGYRYRCVVTDAGGNSASSSAATLTIK